MEDVWPKVAKRRTAYICYGPKGKAIMLCSNVSSSDCPNSWRLHEGSDAVLRMRQNSRRVRAYAGIAAFTIVL